MNKKIFITGTGTDVGKTYVTALLIKSLREKGVNAGYYKPVATGAVKSNAQTIIHDAEYVKTVAELKEDAENMVSYAYEYPASPHLSSRLEHDPPCLEKILTDCKTRFQQYEYLVIEGAGGLVCPLNIGGKRLMLTDVIKSLKADLLVVVPSALGAINAAVLTAFYAQKMNITVKGFILNNAHKDSLIEKDNAKTIETLTKIPVLMTLEKNAANICLPENLLAALDI